MTTITETEPDTGHDRDLSPTLWRIPDRSATSIISASPTWACSTTRPVGDTRRPVNDPGTGVWRCPRAEGLTGCRPVSHSHRDLVEWDYQ